MSPLGVVPRSGRAIFSHVKIALRKIVRTLPANFKALLGTHPSGAPSAEIKKFLSLVTQPQQRVKINLKYERDSIDLG